MVAGVRQKAGDVREQKMQEQAMGQAENEVTKCLTCGTACCNCDACVTRKGRRNVCQRCRDEEKKSENLATK